MPDASLTFTSKPAGQALSTGSLHRCDGGTSSGIEEMPGGSDPAAPFGVVERAATPVRPEPLPRWSGGGRPG